MTTQEHTDFNRIAEAIDYLKQNFKTQPGLEEVAGKINVGPFHFQRMFTEWVGVSPKKFVQYLSVEHAKKRLHKQPATLFDAAFETGLSGTGRLHDLFVNLEGMTPGEYKNGGEQLTINYSFAPTPFGPVLVAATPKGICHLAFENEDAEGFQKLQQQFPNAQFISATDALQQQALGFFTRDWTNLRQIKLHLKATPFQLKVWQALLQIPMGRLATYGSIAQQINSPSACRAVGTAIGSNPIAFLIPCHRVIQSGGTFGQYRWGATRKSAIIGWEAAWKELYEEQ